MNRKQAFALGLLVAGAWPLVVDVITRGWYWNHVAASIPTPTTRRSP